MFADDDIDGIIRRMNPVALDGTWKANIPLACDPRIRDFSLMISLTHHLSRDLNGRDRSEWEVLGCSSYVVPLPDRKFLWHQPSGAEEIFSTDGANNRFGTSLSKGDEIFLNPTFITIAPHNKTSWKYEYAELCEIFSPPSSLFVVSSTGGRIGNVRLQDPSGSYDLLTAQYGPSLKVLHITSGGFAYMLKWSPSDQLESISSSAHKVQFLYEAGLLTEILKDGEEIEAIRWANMHEPPFVWSRVKAVSHTRKWDVQVYLDAHGINIEQKTRETYIKTILNPSKGTIHQVVDESGKQSANFHIHITPAELQELILRSTVAEPLTDCFQ